MHASKSYFFWQKSLFWSFWRGWFYVIIFFKLFFRLSTYIRPFKSFSSPIISDRKDICFCSVRVLPTFQENILYFCIPSISTLSFSSVVFLFIESTHVSPQCLTSVLLSQWLIISDPGGWGHAAVPYSGSSFKLHRLCKVPLLAILIAYKSWHAKPAFTNLGLGGGQSSRL